MAWLLAYGAGGMVSVFAYVWAMLDTDLEPTGGVVVASFFLWPLALPALAAAWFGAKFKARRLAREGAR